MKRRVKVTSRDMHPRFAYFSRYSCQHLSCPSYQTLIQQSFPYFVILDLLLMKSVWWIKFCNSNNSHNKSPLGSLYELVNTLFFSICYQMKFFSFSMSIPRSTINLESRVSPWAHLERSYQYSQKFNLSG